MLTKPGTMSKYLLFLLIPFFFACNGNQDSENTEHLRQDEVAQFESPFDGDFTNSAVFVINPTEENTLRTANGSHFTIPANILVDANGNPVTEDVTIQFDQYHSAVDILASGIPMDYDTLGESYTLESAGMFTLGGTCNDAPVFVKDGATIEMNLASDKGSDQPFNFYEMDPETRDWTYEHSNSPVSPNPEFDPATYTPPKPEQVSEDAFVLDVNFDLSNYEELTVFSGIVWEYTGTEDSLDPRNNKLVQREKWTEFDLDPTHEQAYEYYMTMSNDKASFTTKVKAALDGEDLDLAMEQFCEKKVEIAKKMDELQKPYIRSVEIGGFGTYNYDYIYKIEAPHQLIADFDFGDDDVDKERAMVAVVYEDQEVVVNYPKNKWNLFGLNTQAEAKIIAILPGNRMAVCNEDVTDCYGKDKHTFKMDVLDETIDSRASLIDALASI